MSDLQQLDELISCRTEEGRKIVGPCSIVIFGASGDLTARKLIPALYHLFGAKQLPTPARIIGFARREKSDAEWRAELKTALDQFSRTKPVDEKLWEAFATNVFYCQGDFSESQAYKKLEQLLTSFGSEPLRRNLLFYLATSPSQFAQVAEEGKFAEVTYMYPRPGPDKTPVQKVAFVTKVAGHICTVGYYR